MQKDIIFKKRKSRWSGLKIVAFILAFIPILALSGIIMSLVLNSRVAIHTAGWSLLSDTYKPGFQ